MLREFERAELLKYRPFAAFGAYVRRADFADLGFFVLDDAALLRMCGKDFAATSFKSPKRSLPSSLRWLIKTEFRQIMLFLKAKEVVTCSFYVSVYLSPMENGFSVRISVALRQLMLLCVMSLMLMPQALSAGSSHLSMLNVSGQQHCADMHHEAAMAQDASGGHHVHVQADSHDVMDASICSGMLCSGVVADQTAPVLHLQQLFVSMGLSFKSKQSASISLDTFRIPPKAA